jgi:dephospho-CoA kinase
MPASCRERRRVSMIVVGGDVGAGKSTHARLLVKFHNVIYRGAVYRHVKTFHLVHVFLVVVLLIRYRSLVVLKACKHYSPVRILYVYDRGLFIKLFGFISLFNLIGLLLRSLIQLHLTRALSKVIVVEDHVVGYANDLVYFLYATLKREVRVKTKRIWLLGFAYLIEMVKNWGAIVLFLYADLGTLRERWHERGTPEEFSEYILAGRVASRILSKLIEVHYIDTSRPLIDVFRDIVDKISRNTCH